jgi:hypothetical protein
LTFVPVIYGLFRERSKTAAVQPQSTARVGAELCAAIHGIAGITAANRAPKVRSYNQRRGFAQRLLSVNIGRLFGVFFTFGFVPANKIHY